MRADAKRTSKRTSVGVDHRGSAPRSLMPRLRGRGAPPRAKFAALGLIAAAFLLVPAATAIALPVTVTLSGAGSGTVVSTQTGEGGNKLNCSNSGDPGGPATGVCEEQFPFFGTVTLTATPDVNPALFNGWTGTFGGGNCNTGSANPCTGNVVGPSTVDASFAAPPDPPTVVAAGAAAGAEVHLRTLEGTVDPNEAEVTECYFEYGPTTAYGAETPCDQSAGEIGEGSGPEPVSASTEPLEPGATYHFRLAASSLGGTSESDNASFATATAPADPCSNSARRAEQGIAALLLPDCMALEMVSPPRKGGQAAREAHVSASGNRVRFRSIAALGGTPGTLLPAGDPYVATRGAEGWTTSSTVPPVGFIKGWGGYAEARSFTPDFSRWVQTAARLSQWALGRGTVYQSGIGAPFSEFSPLMVPIDSGEFRDVNNSQLQGMSMDRSSVYLRPGRNPTRYLLGDPMPAPDTLSTPADHNGYVARLDSAGQPLLELLARGRDSKGVVKVWGGNCGARLGGTEGRASGVSIEPREQGALSADGTRAYFSTRPTQPTAGNCNANNNLRIMRRLEASDGAWIGHLVPGEGAGECNRVEPVCSSKGGDDFFQGASLDGSKVYFTTNRQLADTDLDGAGATSGCITSFPIPLEGCDLYLYDSELPPGERLVQVSAGDATAPTPGEGAKVKNGVTAISSDGSHVYFVAEGVLTDEAGPAGDKASDHPATAPKLYLYERNEDHPDGRVAFVGALASGDAASGAAQPGLWGGVGTFRNQALPVPIVGDDAEGNEVGGDGHVLLFQSKASLTSDDGDAGRRDLFRYDADAETLERLSHGDGTCLPDCDDGPFDVRVRLVDPKLAPLGTDFAEYGRWASEDGETIVFVTAEDLVPGDVNGLRDAYLWRAGELFRLPGTADPAEGLVDDLPTLSHDGSTIAFETLHPLLGRDGDTAKDVYVARVGGGYPEPEEEQDCTPGDDCPDEAGPAPAPPSAASVLPRPGNPPPACGRYGKRAQKLSQRAKRLSRNARRIEKARRAKRMRSKARGLSRRARGLSLNAKRCRRASRGPVR